ncbi:hypothetical protein GCM10011331_09540 [Flavimobilis marinus]|nr:hypothetical protein GCM10011331_09540 [Flavimobilis marinus]
MGKDEGRASGMLAIIPARPRRSDAGAPMTTASRPTERELTEPVDLCRPDGTLNPAAVGWSRRPLHRTALRRALPVPGVRPGRHPPRHPPGLARLGVAPHPLPHPPR